MGSKVLLLGIISRRLFAPLRQRERDNKQGRPRKEEKGNWGKKKSGALSKVRGSSKQKQKWQTNLEQIHALHA